MKNLIVKILLIIVLMSMVLVLSGCTLKIETTDNSISASVDGETTEKVDGIIDWIKDRIGRIFKNSKTETTQNFETEPVIGDGEGEVI